MPEVCAWAGRSEAGRAGELRAGCLTRPVNFTLGAFCPCRISLFGGIWMLFVQSMQECGPAQQLHNAAV